jgi:WD40 repeat protein
MARGLAGARLKLGMAVLLVAAALTAGAGLLAHQVRGTTQQGAGPEDGPRPTAARTEGGSREKGRPVRVDRDGLPLPAGAIARLGSLRLYHGEWVRQVVVSPDGRLVASTSSAPDGNRLWDAATGKELPLRAELKHATRFPARGKLLAVQVLERHIQIWDVAAGKQVGGLALEQDGGLLGLSPDGQTLVAWSWGEDLQPILRFCDVAGGKVGAPIRLKNGEQVAQFAFSADGKTLVMHYTDHTIHVWDVATRTQRLVSQVFHTAFSADGKTLAGADGASVTLWDVATGKYRHNFVGHTYCIDALDFSPDGKRLVSGAAYTDTVIRVWDPLTGREAGQLRGHAAGIEALAYAPDGRLVASASQDGTVRLWDPATGKEVRRLEGKDGMVYALAFAPDGRTIATGGKRKAVHLWDVAAGRELRSFDNPGGFILRMAFSPDGKVLATRGVGEKGIRLWDVAGGKQVRQLSGHAAGCPSLAFTPDGTGLASGDDGGVVRVWDVRTGEERRAFAAPAGPGPGNAPRALCTTFAPDGRSLAVGYDDRTVRLWEVASGQERARYTGHRAGVTSVGFAPDGTLLASGASDRTVVVWDVTGRITAGRRPAELTAHELDGLWAGLGGADAAKAHRAAQALLGAGGQAVRYLQERLPPAAAADGRGIARLIADLDSDQFATRERASRELREQGEAAEPALRKALTGNPSAELRRRVKEALEALDPARSAVRFRVVRAVEVLEYAGTGEARRVLQALARGAPEFRLTQEATASLQRLARRADGHR